MKSKRNLTPVNKVSDVFIENFKPGTIDKMGFSYESVKALNPNIILPLFLDLVKLVLIVYFLDMMSLLRLLVA